MSFWQFISPLYSALASLLLGFLLGNGMQNGFGGYVWDFEKAPWRSAQPSTISPSVSTFSVSNMP